VAAETFFVALSLDFSPICLALLLHLLVSLPQNKETTTLGKSVKWSIPDKLT